MSEQSGGDITIVKPHDNPRSRLDKDRPSIEIRVHAEVLQAMAMRDILSFADTAGGQVKSYAELLIDTPLYSRLTIPDKLMLEKLAEEVEKRIVRVKDLRTKYEASPEKMFESITKHKPKGELAVSFSSLDIHLTSTGTDFTLLYKKLLKRNPHAGRGGFHLSKSETSSEFDQLLLVQNLKENDDGFDRKLFLAHERKHLTNSLTKDYFAYTEKNEPDLWALLKIKDQELRAGFLDTYLRHCRISFDQDVADEMLAMASEPDPRYSEFFFIRGGKIPPNYDYIKDWDKELTEALKKEASGEIHEEISRAVTKVFTTEYNALIRTNINALQTLVAKTGISNQEAADFLFRHPFATWQTVITERISVDDYIKATIPKTSQA
jgi:hypothetical protein